MDIQIRYIHIRMGRQPNSFTLKRDNIAIVTGANMAGKRFILAANGAAVCARRFAFVPVSLFSSMRTADNLSKDTSYFQAELSRLRLMLEYVKSAEVSPAT